MTEQEHQHELAVAKQAWNALSEAERVSELVKHGFKTANESALERKVENLQASFAIYAWISAIVVLGLLVIMSG